LREAISLAHKKHKKRVFHFFFLGSSNLQGRGVVCQCSAETVFCVQQTRKSGKKKKKKKKKKVFWGCLPEISVWDDVALLWVGELFLEKEETEKKKKKKKVGVLFGLPGCAGVKDANLMVVVVLGVC
jgi:hypothetical protein